MKILIVDDKQENRYLLQVLLTGNGFEPESADNGITALQKLREKEFDLIISDILMPEMDGYQLCRECKMDRKLKNIPFIFYTATYTDEKDEEFALKLGADDFIRKPLEPNLFIKKIKEVLQSSNLRTRKTKKIQIKQEAEVFKNYSERLVKKLEQKMFELEESEKKFREIFNNSNDAIYLFTLTDYNLPGKILEVNKVMCETLGYTKNELLDMQLYDLFVKTDIPEMQALMKNIVKKERYTCRQDLLTKNHLVIPVEISSHLFIINDEKLILSTARDITDRIKREQELLLAEETWRKTFDSLDEVLMVLSIRSDVLNINRRGEELLNMRRKDILGKKCYKLFFNKETPRSECPFIDAVNMQKSIRTNYYDPTRKKHFSIKSYPIFNKSKNLSMVLVVLADITERNEMEEKLKSYQKNLENIVEERTKKLEDKNKELKNYVKVFEQREFRIKELREEVKRLNALLKEIK